MSIISCTSPWASEVILPTSTLTSVPRSALCSLSSSPKRLITAPRAGAGTLRHCRKEWRERSIAASTSVASLQAMPPSDSPLTGERCGLSPAQAARSTPQRLAASWAALVRVAVVGMSVRDTVMNSLVVWTIGLEKQWFRRC